MIYDLSEKSHESRVSGCQDHALLSSSILYLFTFDQVSENIWNPSISETVDWERKLKDT